MKDKRIKIVIILNILLVLYSMIGVFSKFASSQQFLSYKFCLYYGIVLLLLFIYALGWQQVIKRIPLTTAFANKAITVVWGMIWGIVIFREKISLLKVLGAILVIVGVVLFGVADQEEKHE